jgi:hypothetical protein
LGGFSVKCEILSLGRRACVLNRVVTRGVDNSGELLKSFLTSVGSIPAAIHVGIQTVPEAKLFVYDVNRLSRSVHFVSIHRFEDQDAEIVIVADVGVPIVLLGASIDDLRRHRLLIVGRNLEVGRQSEGSRNA